MRILIATQNYFQPNNGQAVFVRNLAEGLVAEGHSVLALAPSERGRAYEEVHDSLQVSAVSSRSLAPFYTDVFVTPHPRTEVERALAAFRPDIVHIQDHFPLCRSVVTVAAEQGLPLVGTNHFLPENIIPFVPVFSRFARSRAWMERFMWRQVLRVFDRLALASAPTETAAAILRRQGLRIPVEAISCGVDLRAFHPDPNVDRAAMRRRYGLDSERAVFFFVGRVDREKRLDVLLDALSLLDRRDMQLAVAGRGRDLEALKTQANRLGLGDRVVFVGFVPAEDLNALLNSVDIFAMPSEAELQSIATLEAMATGRPVLAANARALPELVEEEVNGTLFHAGDAAHAATRMAQLMDERERWEEMGQASFARVQSHSLPNTVRRYQDFYRRALASFGRTVNGTAPPGRSSANRPGGRSREPDTEIRTSRVRGNIKECGQPSCLRYFRVVGQLVSTLRANTPCEPMLHLTIRPPEGTVWPLLAVSAPVEVVIV